MELRISLRQYSDCDHDVPFVIVISEASSTMYYYLLRIPGYGDQAVSMYDRLRMAYLGLCEGDGI